MSFITPCFIRKNTSELREKLERLGQRQNCFDENECEWLAANYGMYISVQEGFQNLNKEVIDCGTNEELILALAAMTDVKVPYSYGEYYIVIRQCTERLLLKK